MFQHETLQRRARISLTPLIDVVFILLVFFMLASSFLDWRAIDLSAPPASGGNQSLKGAMLVDIRADGLRFGARTMSLDAIAARVAERLRDEPDQRILIRPAQGVPLQRAIDVLDRLAEGGAHNLALIQSLR